jgi:alkylation response protein AidB-like acyl-CoA dehydrogenase
MDRLLTERERTIVELAGRLADRFAERAAAHDVDGSFPFENYDDMREEGYLRLTVPEELGGMGATLNEFVLAQERLAMGDGPTALAVNMHVAPVIGWAMIWQDTRNPKLERILRACAAGEMIWGAFTSEPGMPNNLMDARTIARKVSGGYVVSGSKIFCTNHEVCTHFFFTARCDDPEPRVLILYLPKDADGVSFERTWNTLGMRATQSNDMSITDAFVPEDALLHSWPIDHFDAFVWKMIYVPAMAAFGSIYLGIAASGMDWAKRFVLERGKAEDPLVENQFAEMEIALETARSVLLRHAQEADSRVLFELPVQEGLARATFAKIVAVKDALEIMERVVDVVGGPAYMRRFPLERKLRDLRAGTIMPINNIDANRLIGKTSLGKQIAPAAPLAETGVGDAA